MSTIGIDFGSSGLRAAMNQGGVPVLLPLPYSSSKVPFMVDFVKELDGGPSLKCRIASLKRILDFDQSFTSSKGERNSLDLFTEMLTEVKIESGKLMKDDVLNCVLSLPPCFSQRQRAVYNEAATKAGFSHINLINDTVAALIACRDSVQEYEKVLVYSWGASTFSVVLYHIAGNSIRAIAQEGSRNLGGNDLDTELTGIILTMLTEKLGGALPCEDHSFLDRVTEEAEKVKRTLATGEAGAVSLVALFPDRQPAGFGEHILNVSPEGFEKTLIRMISETLKRSQAALSQAKCPVPDAILTVGGMTRIPAVKKALYERYQTSIIKAGPEAVAIGSVIYGSQLIKGAAKVTTKTKQPERSPREQQISSLEENDPSPGPEADQIPSRWADIFLPYLDSAQRHYEDKRLDKAISDFEKLLVELGKFSADLYQRAAALFSEKGHSKEAFKSLQTANRRHPVNEAIIKELALACYNLASQTFSKKKADESIKTVQIGIDAINSIPNGRKVYPELLAGLHHLKGGILSSKKYYKEAITEIEKSLRLDKQEAYEKDLLALKGTLKKGKKALPKGVPVRTEQKIGRNKKCPCGSGKKNKNCCGRHK